MSRFFSLKFQPEIDQKKTVSSPCHLRPLKLPLPPPWQYPESVPDPLNFQKYSLLTHINHKMLHRRPNLGHDILGYTIPAILLLSI